MRKRDDEKQQRIKEAVMRLILTEGFAGTSVSKIAREADVSPATVYIYYKSKDDMLRDIYSEYSEITYREILSSVSCDMPAERFLRTLMETYYSFIMENTEVFSFVDQFRACPAMSCKCDGTYDRCDLFSILDELKERGELRNYSNDAILMVALSPVKAVCAEQGVPEKKRRSQLDEVVSIIEKALLL